jgi:hypothetical protein
MILTTASLLPFRLVFSELSWVADRARLEPVP